MLEQYFDNVELLLHLNGSNGSTTFTDSSSNGLTVTRGGNVTISTAQAKFGGASAVFDGSGDYLTANNAALALANVSDWTFECWVRLSSLPAARWGVFFNGNTASNEHRLQVEITQTGAVNLYLQGGTGTGASITSNATLNINTWTHIAAVKSGTNIAIYINGTSSATGTYSTAITGNNNFYLGYTRSGGTLYSLDGHLDDVRLTCGVARYSDSFSVPTEEYPNGNSLVAIILGQGALGAPQVVTSQAIMTLTGDPALGVPQALASQVAMLISGTQALGIPQATALQQAAIATGLGALGAPQALTAQQAAIATGLGALGKPRSVSLFGNLATLQGMPCAGQPSLMGHFGYLSVIQGADALGTPRATAFALPGLATEIPQAVTYYFAKLTGAADGLEDAVLPMSSFSVRHRYDGPSYYQLTIPSYAYVSAIAARPNGQIVIWSETDTVVEELLRGDLGSVRSDRGPKSQSISISGNSARAATEPATYLLADALYAYSTFEGDARLRIQPRAAIRPGDFMRYQDLNFAIGEVSWSVAVSAGGMAITMEVTSLPVTLN